MKIKLDNERALKADVLHKCKDHCCHHLTHIVSFLRQGQRLLFLSSVPAVPPTTPSTALNTGLWR